MTNYTKDSDRERLERIFNQPTQERCIKPKFYTMVTNLIQSIIKGLVVSEELHIWQKCDRFGNNWWHAYDPVTGRYTCVSSEAEIRSWIEERYYH
jgi:hypothetical protein